MNLVNRVSAAMAVAVVTGHATSLLVAEEPGLRDTPRGHN
jgi:hypothetical protein